MPVPDIPNLTDILVIGGGPAGAYAASALAREGFGVTVLEKDHFPRYHIGESMLPSCRPFLRFIGAEEKVVKHGFTIKVGAAVKLNQFKREGYTDFIFPDPKKASWNVERYEFDEILLRHATESGATVCEGVQVTGIQFSSSDGTQPVSAQWKSDRGGKGGINFKFLVDASGRNGIVSTKYLKNRKFNQALKNIAFWGYWKGAGMYEPGTRRENAPWFEALVDETGWAWFIPLNGVVSVGVVLKEDASRAKKSSLSGDDVLQTHYLAQLKLAPGVIRLLGAAKLSGEVRSAGDYSYSASHYAGPNFRIAGDAGDRPVLLLGGTLGVFQRIICGQYHICVDPWTLYRNRGNQLPHPEDRNVIYQAAPVLSDVDEDNFDRAFDFLRPIIQGAADAEQSVTEKTLQRTMDFCEHALGPTTPEMHAAVATRVDASLLAHDGPIMDTTAVAALAGMDEEAKQVLWRVNARKAVNGIYDWETNFQDENLGGFAVVLERGMLGLRRVVVEAEAA